MEGMDYTVVSESVWNLLKHEFGCDWEIPRDVIAKGANQKLVVELYPIAFQVRHEIKCVCRCGWFLIFCIR